MKTFVIAIIIFCLTITLVIINFIFIHRTIDRLEEMVISLKTYGESEFGGDDLGRVIGELSEYWHEKKTLVSLSVNYSEINDITNLIASLISFFESGDFSQFDNVHAVLYQSIGSLRRLENFSVDNIL